MAKSRRKRQLAPMQLRYKLEQNILTLVGLEKYEKITSLLNSAAS